MATRFPKITITGDLGSGKSAVSRILQSELQFEVFSTGKVQREIAAKYGMSTLELNQYAKAHREIDDEIDDYSRALGLRDQSLIVDSRLAWHFIPHSFKVFLKVDPDIAAARIMGDSGRTSEAYPDQETCKAMVLQRKSLENSRFLELYGVDCGDLAQYDLVLDTSELSPDQVAHQIMTMFRSWSRP